MSTGQKAARQEKKVGFPEEPVIIGDFKNTYTTVQIHMLIGSPVVLFGGKKKSIFTRVKQHIPVLKCRALMQKGTSANVSTIPKPYYE